MHEERRGAACGNKVTKRMVALKLREKKGWWEGGTEVKEEKKNDTKNGRKECKRELSVCTKGRNELRARSKALTGSNKGQGVLNAALFNGSLSRDLTFIMTWCRQDALRALENSAPQAATFQSDAPRQRRFLCGCCSFALVLPASLSLCVVVFLARLC